MTDLRIKNNKHFYQLLLTIMLPITLQNLISSSLNLVDNVMIGALGENAIAAVGLANKTFFLLSLVLFGINSGCSIFIAQFWGKQEHDPIRSVLSIALKFGMTASFFFFIVSFFFPKWVMGLLTRDMVVIDLGVSYLKIVSISFLVTAISFSFGAASRSIGKPKLPLYASAISLILNTALNYTLINGHFGFTALGVRGAAIATLVARLFEVTLLVYGVYKTSPVLALKWKHFNHIPSALYKSFLKKTTPVILNETFWALGVTMYAVAYSRIGTDAAASVMISDTVSSLFMVLCFGLGNASAIMIGNILGEGDREKAIDYNKKFLTLAVLAGAFVGFAILFLAPLMVTTFYSLTAVATQNTILTLKVMALFMPFRFYNTIVIIGTLRSGGDTLFSMLIEIGCVWGIGVTMAFTGALLLNFPVYWVVGLVSLEEVAKAIVAFPRIKSGRWANVLV